MAMPTMPVEPQYPNTENVMVSRSVGRRRSWADRFNPCVISGHCATRSPRDQVSIRFSVVACVAPSPVADCGGRGMPVRLSVCVGQGKRRRGHERGSTGLFAALGTVAFGHLRLDPFGAEAHPTAVTAATHVQQILAHDPSFVFLARHRPTALQAYRDRRNRPLDWARHKRPR